MLLHNRDLAALESQPGFRSCAGGFVTVDLRGPSRIPCMAGGSFSLSRQCQRIGVASCCTLSYDSVQVHFIATEVVFELSFLYLDGSVLADNFN